MLVLTLFFRFGRRIPNFVCMIVGGVFCLIVLAVPSSKCWYNYRGGEGGKVFQRFPPPPLKGWAKRGLTPHTIWTGLSYISLHVGWVCCWFSPLLQEVFLWVLRFSLFRKNQHFHSTRNQVDEEPLCGCATSKSLFMYLLQINKNWVLPFPDWLGTDITRRKSVIIT